MFRYIEKDSFLHRRNPTVKFLVFTVMTVIICLSYYPIIPVFTVVLIVAITCIGGKIPVKEFLNQIKVFLVIAFSFTLSMLILRGLSYSEHAVYVWKVFTWSKRDLINIFTLGTRILAFVIMSVSFVTTTRPRDIVLSLIMQCKIPVVHGYAVMAAYRFLPELQDHVNSIHLAQEIRGIEWNQGIKNRISSPFRMFIPLFCLAVRRGERIACAMESRGLGGSEERTFYKGVKVCKEDWYYVGTIILIYVILILILSMNGIFYFSFGVN